MRRARNPIGWILQGIALGLVLLSFAGAYSVAGLVWRPGSVPGAVAAAGFAEWVFGPTITALGFLLFLFPTGRLPSPRWRSVLAVGLVAAGITTIGFIVNPVTYGVPAPGGLSIRIANPGGIEALGDAISAVLVVSVLTVVAVVGAAFASLIVRYRSAGRDERQQIKWLAFAAALALVSQAVAFGSLIACGSPVANVAFIGTETDDLRASRRRLVEAQDEERRKIERNLHDGAQQQLLALTVQLGLLERLADDPDRVRQMATQLQGGLRDALDDLRDLARGIYPPLLADKGLAVALET